MGLAGFVFICACFAMGSALFVPAAEGNEIPQRCVEHAGEVSCAEAGADALLPHPADCELFYYCVGPAAAVCRQCPAGLHFSPAEHVCAAPAVAGCTAPQRVRLVQH